MRTVAAVALLALAWSLSPQTADLPSRLARIRDRSALTCGVWPHVPGFSDKDAQGRYHGLDVDMCRAVAAAIFGTPDKVRFVDVSSVTTFRQSSDIDIVSRRLTWELRREAPLGLLFGPTMFYDGQGFLVAKRLNVREPWGLSGTPICVAIGTPFESRLRAAFNDRRLKLETIELESAEGFGDIAAAFQDGRCSAYTADVSELGAVKSLLAAPADFVILDEQISKEPLAQLVRQDDPQFFDIVRWTVFALIEAEELGITSANVDDLRASPNVDVQRFLGITPGNGEALGLSERWAYNVVKTVGNYGELFDKNVGRRSAIGLDRGLNRLWTQGGLMYAPPLR